MSSKILVVDDERNLRLMLEQMLQLAGHEVECAESGEEAIPMIEAGTFDAVLLDVRLGGMDGLQVLQKLRRISADLPVIMMSGHGSISTAVTAVRAGAFDFLEKPLTRDKTLFTLENALQLYHLRRENRQLRSHLSEGELLGESPVMLALRSRIDQVGPTESRILIQGESGSGKELVARAIHRKSRRWNRSFIAVNCAAFPAELIESELFGHVRGAFTGATSAQEGVFECAHQGTLFLDEIGDMPLPMQAKLLRVIESGELSRVGSRKSVKVDVRILSATHRDLSVGVDAGSFRQDLFHRLNVVPLPVPPLRERPEDIPLLAEAFLENEIRRQDLSFRRFSAGALQTLGRYSWPGNVRELRNLVERVAILCPGNLIDEDFVTGELPVSSRERSSTLRDAVEMAERRTILNALRGSGGNVSEAARRLGLERSHLYKKAKGLGISLGGNDSPE